MQKYKDLSVDEAIAFYQLKFLDQQGYLSKFQMWKYLLSLKENEGKPLPYKFPDLLCEVHLAYNSFTKIVKRQEPDTFITDFNVFSMKGRYKDPDQIQMELKKDGFIVLPFFLSGFFNKIHLKDKDIIIKEEKNSVIGSHQSCKINGFGGIYPPMTVFEYICVKDIEVEGNTIRDVTILKPTFKTSSLQNDTYPSVELIECIRKRETENIKTHFKLRPMTYLEGHNEALDPVKKPKLLHWAAEQDYHELIEILCTNVVNVNDQENAEGQTALHIAGIKGHPKCAQKILDHMPDPFLKDKNGKDPLSVSSGETATLIKEYQAKLLKALDLEDEEDKAAGIDAGAAEQDPSKRLQARFSQALRAKVPKKEEKKK